MNKVFMIGRLASDVEIRATQSGMQVAQYRLAVNRRKRADGQQEADFFPCVAWDKGAAFAAQYLSKGAKIAIVGHLQTRSWDAQDGTKRYATEIIVDEHEFCESKGAGSYQQEQSAPTAEQQNSSTGGFMQVDCEDLPF